MAARLHPNPRRQLGLVMVVAGVGAGLVGSVLYLGNRTGLLPTIPYAGFATTALGSLLEAAGVSLVRGTPVLGQLEDRRTSLVIVLPALVLFTLVLLGASLIFGENFERPASAGRWVGSAAFLAISTVIVSLLLRDLLLRFDRHVSRSRST